MADGYVVLDSLTEWLSTPATVANELTGVDFRLEVDCALVDYTNNNRQILVAKYMWDANNTRHWQFYCQYSYLNLDVFDGSSGTAIGAYSVNLTGVLTDGVRYKLRVDLDINVGGTQSTAKFYYSTNGVDYTQIGTDQTIGNTVTLNAVNNTTVTVGATGTGEEGAATGTFYRARGWSGFGVTPVFDGNLNDYVSGSSWTSVTTGETWTVNGSPEIHAPTGGGTPINIALAVGGS